MSVTAVWGKRLRGQATVGREWNACLFLTSRFLSGLQTKPTPLSCTEVSLVFSSYGLGNEERWKVSTQSLGTSKTRCARDSRPPPRSPYFSFFRSFAFPGDFRLFPLHWRNLCGGERSQLHSQGLLCFQDSGSAGHAKSGHVFFSILTKFKGSKIFISQWNVRRNFNFLCQIGCHDYEVIWAVVQQD